MPDLSPDNPGLLIMDGHGSHFTLELLTYCRSIGLHIILRPPHITHILQGEDVQHFAVFKPKYSQAKLLRLGSKVARGKYRLQVSDLLSIAREPWEEAFNLENSLKVWDKIGVAPFTRRVYWELVEARSKREEVAATAEVDPSLLTVAGMVRLLFPASSSDADDAPAHGADHGRNFPPAGPASWRTSEPTHKNGRCISAHSAGVLQDTVLGLEI